MSQVLWSRDLSSQLQWTDNGVPLGSGSLLSKVLSLVGVHTIAARVTDSGGLQGSSQVGITITVIGGTTTGTLTATKRYTSTGWQKVDLRWSGLTGSKVDVYRNAVRVMTIGNDGAQTDSTESRGPGAYTYRVCVLNTQTCTPNATVVF